MNIYRLAKQILDMRDLKYSHRCCWRLKCPGL